MSKDMRVETREGIQRAFEQVADAITHVGRLIDDVEGHGDPVRFKSYPKELPSLDELEFAVKSIEVDTEEDLYQQAPDFDTVEAAGLDGTGRTGGPFTWKDVALAALAKLDEIQKLAGSLYVDEPNA